MKPFKKLLGWKIIIIMKVDRVLIVSSCEHLKPTTVPFKKGSPVITKYLAGACCDGNWWELTILFERNVEGRLRRNGMDDPLSRKQLEVLYALLIPPGTK